MTEVLYIISGLISGVAAGMGMGGGTILIPMLTLLCGMQQHGAQGVNVAAFIPAAIAALIIHRKEGRLDIKSSIPIVIAGVAGALAAALFVGSISDEWLRKIFGGFLIATAIVRTISSERKRKRGKARRVR